MEEIIDSLNNSFGGQWFKSHSKTTIINQEYYDGCGFRHEIMVEFTNIYTLEKYSCIRVKAYSKTDSDDVKKELEVNVRNWLMNGLLFSKETDSKFISGDGCMIRTFADIKKEILEFKNKYDNGRN